MKEIQVRNIFVDIFLAHYFRYAYNIAISALHSEGKKNTVDENTLQRIYSSISSKIGRVNVYSSKNCAFLNLAGLLNLPIKQIYPVRFTLSSEELFWFEYIINMEPTKFFGYYDNCKNVQQLRRLYSVPSDFPTEFLAVFNNIQAIDLIRKRFINGEKIGNESARVGFYIDSKTGVAHRVNS